MAGYTTYVAGSVLTAASVNSYLMQQVVISQTSAPTATHEGMVWYDQTNNRVMIYNGGWVPTQIATVAGGRIRVQLRRTANQSIADTTETNVSFDTENVDTDGFWASGATSTVPTGMGGLYVVGANAIWAGPPAGLANYSYLQLTVSGNFWRSDNISTRASVCTPALQLDAGASMSVQVYQSSGSSINLTDCQFSATRISA